MKYDKIVAMNKDKSRHKAEIAINEIHNMVERKERVTVTELVRITGFSKALFYDNIEVRTALDDARRKQGACYNPKQVIIDRVMEEKLKMHKNMHRKLKKEVEKLKAENTQLIEENKKLPEYLNGIKM